MGQDRISGAAGSAYGHEMASKVASYLGTQLLSNKSNEAYLEGKRIVIKCAHYKTPQIGVSEKMLERIDVIISALEIQNGDYKIYRLTPKWYKSKMSPSKSKKRHSANKVMMVSCEVIINNGQHIATMRNSENAKTSSIEVDSKEEIKAVFVTDKIVEKLKKAIKAALDYEKIVFDKRKLGITAEVGEVLACHRLGLKLILDTHSKGFDAIDKDGKLVQIKSRRSESEGLPNDAGRVGTFSKHHFDYALLVLLDHNYKLCEIWRAVHNSKLKQLIERQKRRNPNLASFKHIAKKVFPK